MKVCLLLVIGAACASASRGSWANLAHGVATGLTGGNSDFKGLRTSASAAARAAEDPDPLNGEGETKLKLPNAIASEGERTLPVTVEAGIATIWCLMIGCIPFILVLFSEKEVTTIHYVEGVFLIIWLVGGIFAFTNIILFQSAHFEGIRSLTMVESTYLLTQILTTIGYGDITPAMPRGQVVCAFYILLSVVLVGNMFSQVVEMIEERVSLNVEQGKGSISLDEADTDVQARMGKRESELMTQAGAQSEPTSFEWKDQPTSETTPMLKAFLVYVVCAMVGILFFHYCPGEEKTWLQAIYMSIVTLSTVGFGAFTATSEIGKAFASFWMLIGVAALGNFVGSCVEWSLTKKACDAYCPDKDHKEWTTLLSSMDRDGDEMVDAEEFMKFALVHAGYCTEEQIEKVSHFFRRMHPVNGKVPMDKFEQLGAPADGHDTGNVSGTPRKTPRSARSHRGGLKGH